ncbi:hypothetical protein BD410DRAFT_789870 [Rickenella mellea]|uniref:DUF6699 domain-containing protein n=1 Tax=Rickenella mellea TaxID=50990 RepID=A0A4Y7Q1B1_9AGAM|nr:hypothetical protein BD410DRAFT_789870 [Rickenella mellea]
MTHPWYSQPPAGPSYWAPPQPPSGYAYYTRPPQPHQPLPPMVPPYVWPYVPTPGAGSYAQPLPPGWMHGERHHDHRSMAEVPDLNPVLEYGKSLLHIDIRRPPRESIARSAYYDHRDLRATGRPTRHMRIVAKEIPWVIDVRPRHGVEYVSCGDVWNALYNGLQVPLKDSEWGLAGGAVRNRRDLIEEAAERRFERMDDVELQRVDWLVEKTIFQGLQRDVDLWKRRLLPGTDECSDTYVAKFSAP